jgi:hypothetical protein
MREECEGKVVLDGFEHKVKDGSSIIVIMASIYFPVTE